MTAKPNLMFTLPVVVLTGPSDAGRFAVAQGERVVLFARGYRVTRGPLLEPGHYEVTGDIVDKNHLAFPVCIATVRYQHVGAFQELEQEEIDGLMDVIERAVTAEETHRGKQS
jgi:hypothetical protein